MLCYAIFSWKNESFSMKMNNDVGNDHNLFFSKNKLLTNKFYSALNYEQIKISKVNNNKNFRYSKVHIHILVPFGKLIILCTDQFFQKN